MKNFKKMLLIAVLILLAIAVYIAADFELFDNAPLELTRFKRVNSKNDVAVCYIPSNATQQEYIQVRKIISNNSFVIIKSFERYQSIGQHKWSGDTLQIVLLDTASYKPRKDTASLVIDN
ncbi:hypothetical protein [Fibrella aquatilis]|uniref:Uncharacterized protein n=1 Tax=Fibrella aquatilis TaxID=2817059 RepID=A0A939K218_9BACT|nr:hypothetical protein [Fibrella aquatilis]MBO0934103.1 hypothetical protein [Fibrella aquatilis]